MSQDPIPTTVPLCQGHPITAGWWWLQFPDGPGPRHWDGTFWDRGSYFATAEDYVDNPVLGPCPLPGEADLLAMASAFALIPFNPRGDWRSIRELKVERRRVDPEAWSIGSEGKVLMRDGMWCFEPSPSNRDDDFLSETRWPTAREAIEFARKHMAENPTGYTEEHRQLCWAKPSETTAVRDPYARPETGGAEDAG